MQCGVDLVRYRVLLMPMQLQFVLLLDCFYPHTLLIILLLHRSTALVSIYMIDLISLCVHQAKG